MKKRAIFRVFVFVFFFLLSAMVMGTENLSIRIIGPDSVKPGELITYTIIYLNGGDTKASNVEITQNLPSGNYTYVSSLPQGTYSSVSNTITWNKSMPGMSFLESLGAGAHSIQVTVRAGVKGGTPGFASGFSPLGYYISPNPATLVSFASIKSDVTLGVNSSNVTTIVKQVCTALLNIAQGSIKSATGTPVVYLVQVINSGNIYNRFDLIATNYQCGTLGFDPLTWRFLDITGNVITKTGWIAPGESFLVLFEVSCPPGSNPGKFSCHTVSATSEVCNTTSAVEHTQTEIVQSPKEALVLLAKMASKDVVQSGDTLVYALYAFNSNNSYAAYNFSITDVLPSNVTYISHSVVQKNSTLTSSSYTPGTRTLNLNFSSLSYGTDNAITVNVVTVVNSTGGVCSGSFSNTASATYTGASALISSTKSTTITNMPDLKITKKASPTPYPAAPNGTIKYTLVYENLGTCTASNVQITDYYDNTHTTDGGANTGTKSFGPFTMAPGAKDSVTYTVNIMDISKFPDGTTTILNVANVTCAEPESDYNNNTANASVYVEILPDLAVTKTVNSEPGNILEVGKNYTYTITVVNNGEIAATNVAISDTLPTGFTFISASNGGTLSGKTITWPTIASIAAGASETVTCTVQINVSCDAIGGVTNVAYASSSKNDSYEANNTAHVTSTAKDVEKPTITCATPAASYPADNGLCTFTVTGTQLDPVATADNCSVKSVINSKTNSSTLNNAVFALGTTHVMWVITDGSDNKDSCEQIITVVDNQKPEITVPSAATYSTNTACTYVGTIGTATATDNCTPSGSIAISNDAPAAFPLGTTTVTWSVQDAASNIQTGTQLITVIDTENPIAVSKDVTVSLSVAGSVTIAAADVNNNSTDNCGIQSMSVSPSIFGCSDVGTHTVTLTVTDNSGNIATSTSTVTVTDPSAPDLSINDVTVTEGTDPQAVFTVSLSSARLCDVSFTVNTANNTAIAGSDYTAKVNQVYTIPAGQTSVNVNVLIGDNVATEPTETFYVNVSNPVNAVISDGQGIATILDNDAVSVAINDVSVNESAGNANFTVTLTGNIQDALTVDYATANVTALSGSDYTALSGTLTFDAGSLSGATKTISVPILNDAFVELTETFNVNLSNLVTTGTATIADNLGLGTITDNDAVSVAINDVSVSEAAGSAVFTVTLTGNIQDALTVNYASSNVTALAGSDYTLSSGTLTFAAGSVSGSTKTITVPILNDLVAEPTETFNMNLSNIVSNGSASISDNLGVGTITDNDAVSIAINDVTVLESAGNATFTVTLTGNIQDALTVDYTTANGTALAGSDYTTTSGTLTFAAGSVSGATKTITVPILNDAITEPSETFNVNLSNIVNTGSATIADNQGLGTITDNDAVSIAINDVSVAESAGTATFTVTLTGNIQDALTVNYVTSNVTALAGSDYTTTSGTLTFAAGSISGATQSITVPILNDVIAEPTETFNVNLNNIQNSGTATISDNLGVGTIIDNDAVTLAINDVSVNESAGTETFTVTLTGNIQDALTFNYATSNATATAGSDYTAASGSLTFAAGSVSGATKTIVVTILNDAIAEPTETYNMTLSSIVFTGSASFSDNLGVGTITDNDAASVAINDVSVNESAGTATLTVTLTGNIQNALTVDYATSNGTATSGSDYTAKTGTVTFPASSVSGATQSIVITILNDANIEPTETFNVNLSNIVSSGSASISDNLGIVTITDNDAASVAINDVTVAENAGTATFTVTLTGNIQDALTVDYATSNGTALAGSDYTAKTGTLTFPAGSISGATQLIVITILNDAISEPIEAFNVNLSNIVSTGSASISDNRGVGTITDDAANDAVSIAINDVTVAENAGTATFTVTLTGNIQDALTVDYATANGTALSGSDYTAKTGTLTFPAGSISGATQTIVVTILNDAVAEPTETFGINLSNLVSTGSASIADGTSVCTISDNDAASVAINDVSVAENAGTATLTVTLTGNIQNALTVDYATSNGTATAGSDYTAKTGTVTFPAGSVSGATQSIVITILNDAISEPTESFNVNLSNLVSTGSASISDNLGVVTITDDASNDAVTIAINNVTVAENAGTATFTVTLTGNIQDALTVDYATSNGTALAGSDYTAKTGIVTFPAGSISGATQSIVITILNDAFAEPSETFNVNLSNIVTTGSASFGHNPGVGTITDDAANDAVSVAINDVSVNESAGTAQFTVTLTGNIQDALTVDYATSNVTAIAGSDYTANSGTLMFPANSLTGTTRTITIAINNDNNLEPTETFNVNLSNIVSTGTASISDNLGVGTITDNDAASVAINDVSATELAGVLNFTVTLSGNIQDALTVDFATANVTALAGSDYTATSGTLTFPAGSVSGATQTIPVIIADDGIAEATETFNVNLSNLVSTGSAIFSDNTGVGTIIDKDAVSVVINDVTVNESDGTATFTVTLNGTIASNLTVDYATSDVTALAGTDYTATSGTLTFTPTDATLNIIVPILDNDVTEPTETFNMNLSNIQFIGAASIDDNLGVGTILDDAVTDAVSVAINDVTVNENAGTATFTVTLTGNIQDALTVDYATSDVTALAGSDYTTTSGTLTFPAASVSGATQSIVVPIIDNTISEPTETFNVNLSNIVSTGHASISDNLGVGTILDDAVNDAVSVAINDVTVNETDGNAVFTVTLTGNIQDALTVDFATSDVTALAGSDYTAQSGTLTFPANSVSGATLTISVAIINNNIAEPTETFNVTLSNLVSTGSASISDAIGVGTILDDAVNDAVSVAINDVTVNETDGNAVFTVTLTGNIQDALTVDFATSDVTALAGSDYTAKSGTVTFPANSVSGATQTISIAIIDNTISEPTETFNVTLSNLVSTGSASISDALGVGTILDDAVNDAVSVAIDDVTVSETDGNAVFTVTLTGNIQDALTVDFATSDVTALAGSDYTAKSGTVTFPANSISGATQTISIAILNNNIAEPTETFSITLSNIESTGSASISDDLGVGTILDDAVNDAVSVAINDVSVSETDGNAIFTVTLTGNIQDALTVDFATSDVTAIAGSDYTAKSGTVTFPANSFSGTTQTISIAILNNNFAEPTETFNVTLSNLVSTGSASISDALGVGTILDDAVNNAVSVAIDDVTVSETDGNAVFTVTLTGNIQDALTVDFATSDVTALASSDYTAKSGTVTFPANSISGATQTISIAILNNNIAEPTETFNVTLSNLVSTGSASISDALGVGTILDDAVNDAVSIAINDVTVSETDGNAIFTVTLTGNIQDALTVDYATSDGTADAGSDYTATNGTVTFPAGSIDGATQTITVPIIDNTISEPTETFNVDLSNLISTGTASISDDLGIGTILDDAVNDAVSVAINDVTVNENAGTAVFTVTLTGNIQDALTVDFATADGTALAGSDYTAISGTVTFPANSISGDQQSIVVAIIDNLVSEPTESFKVDLSNLVSTGSASISDAQGICTILDDAANDKASVSINDITVNETDGTSLFTVSLSGNIQDALTVDYATNDGTAKDGSDYTAVSGTVTFPAGSISGTTKTIVVTIIDNDISEPTETFNMNLSNLVSTGSASISDAVGVCTILDDAVNDAVSVAINDVTVSESAGNAVFTVTLTGNIQDALTVDFATSDGTAKAGTDYTATSGTVTFPAGSIQGATQTISIPIIDNTMTEPTETFNVNLSNLVNTGSATISDALGIGTILDDAVNDAVSVAINDVTVSENAGNAIFTVTLTGNIQDALTVDFATSNVTALAGSDYTATSGTVTFPAGSVTGATKNITVPIINNLINEPTETFNVNLSNIQSTGTATISDNLGVGTILDDAANDAVSIAINDVTVNESAGMVMFTITLTGNTQDQLTVDYVTSNGTALAGSDYTATSGKVIFPAGSVNESVQTIIVPVTNDVLTEPTETLHITLSNIVSNGTASITDNAGVGTILDNDASSVAINDVTVAENAGTATFTVTLTGSIQDALTVNYATSDGTAKAGSDFTIATGTVTFPAGSVTGTTKSITVAIINDAITEPTETFNVNLSGIVSTGTATISDNLGIGTITDDATNDAVKIAINDVTVAENAGTATFTVTLTGNIQDQLSVDFASSNITALAGSDYTIANGTLIFPANSVNGATRTFTVAITDDAMVEPTETFKVTLSNIVSTGSASISDNEGICTITDNDVTNVAINDVTVNENAGTAVFTVTLNGNVQNDLSVDFATSDGTALAGSDYTTTSGTIVFVAGTLSGATHTITVPIIDNSFAEPTETFNVNLSNIVSTGTATISDNLGVGTILDDAVNDAVTISIDDVTASEKDGLATFTVTLTGNIQDALTVDYATTDITAKAASDYSATSGTITFPAGSVTGTKKTITVGFFNNAIAEPTETYKITLSNLVCTGPASISDDIGIGTITDDDVASISINDVTVNENDGFAMFTVSLTGNIQDVMTVDYASSNGTALAGSDYTTTTGTVTLPAGSVNGTMQFIMVPILDNTIAEPTETFNMNLSNLVNSGATSISDNLGICTILDDAVNDAVTVSINDVTVNETDGNAIFTVTLNGNIQDALTVDYATSDVTALAGSDYTAKSGTLTFPAGSITGTTRTITVPIIDNSFAEPTETFNVNLSNLVCADPVAISDNLGIGTIIDDAASDGVSVVIDDVTVSETAGNAVFTVTLTGNIQDAMTVDFATSDVTALAGSDYTAMSGTLTFPAGSLSGAIQTITVPIIDNAITEPTETFNVNLSNIVCTGSATISDNLGLGTITDDAVDAVGVSINDVTVSETDGTAVFTVTLTGNIQDDLTVDFATSDVTAKAGSDYTATSGTLTFPAGSANGATQSITVPILNDDKTEPTETYTVTLSNLVNSGTASFIDAVGLGTITDDAANDAVSVSINDMSVSETAGTAIFTVTLTGNIQDAMTVNYTTTDVTAITGNDYTVNNGTITFPAGSLSGATQTIVVNILDDASAEPTETYDVNLSNIQCTGSATIIDNLGLGTITDNDVAGITINDKTVSETAGSAIFTVTLTGNIQDNLSVDFATSDVTANAGSDYTATSGTLTFAAGSVSGETKTITVPIIDNNVTEPTETFDVNLTNLVGTGTVSINDNLGLGTITDDAANDAVSVAINDIVVDESVGTAVLNVTLNGNIQDAMTVDFATSNGTALTISDYTATTGTVTFPAGSISGATESISIPIVDNNIVEPTETFDVTISNIACTGSATISDNMGTVSITDNDAASVAIDDVSVSETAGTAVFTVTLSGNIQDAMTVDFATSDVTAKAGTDYTSTMGILTFNAGSLDGATQTITVPIIDNNVTEPTETFDVNLSNLVSTGSATISDNLGVGTITDDLVNDAVSVAVNDVEVHENDGNVIFSVVLNGNIQDALTVDYVTSNGTAKAITDFTQSTGTVTFPAGSTSGTLMNISVPLVNNTIAEPTETFDLNLSNVVNSGNASISDNLGVGTILDDDKVSLTIDDVTVNETGAIALFSVTLNGDIQDALSFNFETKDETAIGGNDYIPTSGTLTFAAGSLNGVKKSISVSIIDDEFSEPAETFDVILSKIVSTAQASFSDSVGLGIINDAGNDAATIAIDSIEVNEADLSASFTVTLTGNIQDAATFDYSTSDGTAKAPDDYTAKSGTLTFAAGSKNGSIKIVIPITNDEISEPNEKFLVNLSNLVKTGDVSFSNNVGECTIIDDESITINLKVANVTETNATQTQNFVAEMTGTAQQDVILAFTTTDGTATSASDYVAQNKIPITIKAGETSADIPVDILGDLISEPKETFIGTITITNDNGQPVKLGIDHVTDTILDDDIADMEITKAVSLTTVSAGNNITYTITVTNKGINIAQEVEVEDVLPAELVLVSASATVGTWTAPKWSIGAMNMGDTETLTIVARVKTDVANNTSISNTAEVSSDTYDPVLANNTSTISTNVLAESDMAILKTLQTSKLIMGQAIQYQIHVKNNGPSDAFTVNVVDNPPGVNSVEYSTDNGLTWKSWTSPYNIGTILSGDSVDFLMKGLINLGQCNEFVNAATVSSQNFDPDISNNTSTISATAEDHTAPTITCATAVNTVADDNMCTASGVALELPVISDNCSLNAPTNDAPSEFPIGETIVKWTVTDGAGNAASCNQTVTVIDDQIPTINCPAPVIVAVDDGSYSTKGIELGTPVTTDNCTIASVTNNAPAVFPLGNSIVIWTVTDASGNSKSCEQSVVGPKKIFIPTGFSPNGDGVNDYFVITDIQLYPNNHFWVYNRWGNLIYDKKTYDNSWDGKLNVNGLVYGDELPEGTYFYILDLGNSTPNYQGYIIIKR